VILGLVLFFMKDTYNFFVYANAIVHENVISIRVMNRNSLFYLEKKHSLLSS
jgi:hypothetical protein